MILVVSCQNVIKLGISCLLSGLCKGNDLKSYLKPHDRELRNLLCKMIHWILRKSCKSKHPRITSFYIDVLRKIKLWSFQLSSQLTRALHWVIRIIYNDKNDSAFLPEKLGRSLKCSECWYQFTELILITTVLIHCKLTVFVVVLIYEILQSHVHLEWLDRSSLVDNVILH